MSSIKHKLIAVLIAMALLAGSLSVLVPSYPARALMPTAETISIPMVLFQGVLKAVEGGLYVILRKYVQQGIKNITKDTANYLFKGGKGKGPAYETKPWDNFWEEVGDEAVGAALEGFVQGSVNEYEAQKKKGEVYKSLEDTKEKTKQLSLEGGDLNYKLKACNQQSIGLADSNEITTKIKECDAIAEQLKKKGEEQEKFYTENAGRLKAQGVREDYSKDLETLRKDLETKHADAKAKCDSSQGGSPTSVDCRTARQAVIDKAGDIDTLNKKADAAFASADPASSEAIKGIEKDQIDKDGALVTGQTGALSEVGRTIVDIVCKPEADFALQIFLGLGDQISQTRRKPICPLDVLKKNWKRVITDAGFEPGGLLSEQTVDAWQSLASFVNPETSDLGVAWKVSVAGHDVRDIARQLGVTDYGATAALGGYKGVTNLAKTAITSPAGAVGKAIDSTIESNFEGATRFVPTEHIVADLIITAGAAFLETTLDLVRDGLRKRQVVRKQPKGKNLSGLRPYIRSSLYSPDADPNAGTEAYAEATLAVFDELKYTGEQSWDVLNRITATGESSLCYDPRFQASEEQKATDPESCSIDEDFNRAIREGMTVQQAMNTRPPLLNPDGIFGFNVTTIPISPGSNEYKIEGQPPISKNYPYNSLVILRKYRIIPVSWELAALYIKEKPAVCAGKKCTLGRLVAEFNDPNSDFYQMVDPNWVLMVPPTKCMLEGYGPQVIQELEIPDQNYPEDKSKNTKQVVRAKTCVDYQTCLGQDATGKCERGYGYCLKEEFVMHFTGETCEPKYNSCRSFTDATTKQNLTALTSSLADYGTGRCTAENAGCAWYSATRQYQKNATSGAIILDNTNREKVSTTTVDPKTQKEWSNAADKQVFFASSAQKCEPQAEGCRQVNGPVGTPPYLRFPPESLDCATDGEKKDGSKVQWYKREECKKYTQLCRSEYVGCERYMPQNDEVAVTGKSPDDSVTPVAPNTKIYQYRCPAACANIYAYAEQKTLFEPLGTPATTLERNVYFNVATAQKCSVANVGCEEFTNLDESRRGGEDKDYFTYLQRCVKEANPESIPANEVFYHFVGSDTAGGQPEKHYVVGTGAVGTDTYAPACADGTNSCDCSAETAEKSKNDPRIGANPCREFINANGKPFYRYAAELIYRTPDCTSYRRTIDNQEGVANTYSPGLSRRCSAAAVNCREYRAPQAGNIHVLPKPDNFENQSVSGWQIGRSSNSDYVDARISNEGEIIGDHSLKAAKKNSTQSVTFIQLAKRLPIQKDKTYHIRFHLKAPAGSQLNKLIIDPVKQGTDSTKVITLSYDEPELSGAWQQFQTTVTKDMMAPYELLDTSLFRITVSKNNATVDPEFYLDDVIIKEVDGIEYVIRDSWVENREARCFTPKGDGSPDWVNPRYPGCSLYTDRQGAQQAIRSFERICPNEMAGCVQVTVKEGKVDATDNKKLVDSEPKYIIPDASKACQASDNKCTAYGVPKLLTKADGIDEQLKTSENKASDESRNEWKYREEWNIAYLKVTPEEALAAQSKFISGDMSPYASGICRTADLGCRTYNPSGGGDTYFRDPGKRVCQPPNASYPNWYYYTCEKSTTIICSGDDDCPIKDDIQEKCNINSKKICLPPTIANIEVNYDNVDDKAGINNKRCSCDKDDSIIDCKDAIVARQNPWGNPICHDRFKKGAVNYYVSVFIDPSSSFVRSCPVDANGCRKITDPNCKLQTNGNHTLKNNYGRTPGTTDSGISCKPDYYFTEDFKTRTDECNLQVNPGGGCILFDDEKLQRFEYQINKGNHCENTVTKTCSTANTANATDCPTIPDSSPEKRETCVAGPLAIVQNPAPSNPTYCVCDRNTNIESDCSEKAVASASDPDTCYNRYYDIAAVGEKNLLRTYTKVRVESRYNSTMFYEEARIKGGATNVTAAAGGTGDANTLIKVRPDRQCKVWLECQSYEDTGSGRICKRRAPCASGKPGVPCESTLQYQPYLDRLQMDASIGNDSAKKEPRKELLTLSGYARPDYKFSDGTQTKGGYDAYFDSWNQLATVADTARASALTYQRVVPAKGKTYKVCSNNLGKTCTDATAAADCPTFNNFVGTCIDNPGYLLACRLSPKSDSPSTVLQSQVVDACRSETGSGGIYGYCLQPNPRFENEYALSHPYETTDRKSDASQRVGKRVCSKSINTSCDGQAADFCETNNFGTCVYRYYENYCLNWFPIDRTGREIVFDSTNAKDDRIEIKYQGPSDTEPKPRSELYYCLRTKTLEKKIRVDYTPADNVYSVERYCNADGSASNSYYSVTFGGCNDVNNKNLVEKKAKNYIKPENVTNAVVIAHSEEMSTEEHINKPQGTEADVMRADIENIEYTLQSAFLDHWGPNYVTSQTKYAGITNQLNYTGVGTDGFGAHIYIGDNTNFVCDNPKIDTQYIYIKPSFDSNDKFNGWVWKVCRWKEGGNNIFAAIISTKINVRKRHNIKSINYAYNETYCSEYVKVASGNNLVVPARTKLTPDNLKGIITTVVPPHNDDEKMALYKREKVGWDKQCNGQNEQEVRGAKQYKVHQDGKPIQTSISGEAANFSCDPPQLSLGPGSGYFEPCYGDKSDNGKDYCDKIGEDKPGGIKVLMSARTTNVDFETVRNKTPFNKVYEYWVSTGSGARYLKQEWLEGNIFNQARSGGLPVSNFLDPFWTETKRIGRQPNRRPRIFQYDNGGAANRFNASVSGDNSLSVSFYVNVHDDQTPIKRYALYLPYGRNTHDSGSMKFDGTGFKESFTDSGDDTSTPGAGNKIKFGDFFEAYEKSDFTDPANPFGGHKICVEVTDNWEACTRTCGTFRNDKKEIDNNSWTPGDCTGDPVD